MQLSLVLLAYLQKLYLLTGFLLCNKRERWNIRQLEQPVLDRLNEVGEVVWCHRTDYLKNSLLSVPVRSPTH